jgi:phosphoserine aminotransferase
VTAIFNFGAGPAALPRAVYLQAQAEMLDWQGSGLSILEVSHRSAAFIALYEQAVADLRELLDIPAHYQVLFLQGGATAQFSMVPANLLRGKGKADYIQTGTWSDKAILEARRYCDVHIAASSAASGYTFAPKQWAVRPDTAYVHYTANETIHGVEFHTLPETGAVPLACDMSSSILSRPVDVARHGIIYAGAQKNIGPAGLTVVIVREDLMGQVLPGQPAMVDYQLLAEHRSMYNTPPTFAIYIASLVFKWLKQQGGVAALQVLNHRKAELLYHCIDQSNLYINRVQPQDRSLMNVPFTLDDPGLETEFLRQAEAHGLLQLKGHRSVGGLRASLYNAMPFAGVQALVRFMDDFARTHGFS